MNRLGSKADLPLNERSLAEELVEKSVPIAFAVSVARDEAGELAVFHRNLDELTFAQERVHARNFVFITSIFYYAGRGRLTSFFIAFLAGRTKSGTQDHGGQHQAEHELSRDRADECKVWRHSY